MEAISDVGVALRRLVNESDQFTMAVLLGLALLLVAFIFGMSPAAQKKPPMLRETIPYISNTYQYMADMNTFLSRAT
jgi:hypothetical protein